MLGLLVALGGCSAHTITQEERGAQAEISAAEAECYRAQAASETSFTTQLMGMTPNSQLVAALLHDQGRTIAMAVGAATGNSYNPCKSTNVFDAQIVEVTAKNKAASSMFKSGVSVIKWGVVALGLEAITDSSGGASSISNYEVSGEGNTLSVDSFKSGTDNIMTDSTLTSGDSFDGMIDNSVTEEGIQ